MAPDVVEACVDHDFVCWLKFSDGTEGFVDLEAELYGPVFEPLRDPEFFRRFRVDPDVGTLVWDNGADFAPEFLFDEVRRMSVVGTASSRG